MVVFIERLKEKIYFKLKTKEGYICRSEFAPLRKVVLTQSELIFPGEEDNVGDYAFLPEEIFRLYEDIDIQGKNYKDVFPLR